MCDYGVHHVHTMYWQTVKREYSKTAGTVYKSGMKAASRHGCLLKIDEQSGATHVARCMLRRAQRTVIKAVEVVEVVRVVDANKAMRLAY